MNETYFETIIHLTFHSTWNMYSCVVCVHKARRVLIITKVNSQPPLRMALHKVISKTFRTFLRFLLQECEKTHVINPGRVSFRSSRRITRMLYIHIFRRHLGRDTVI